jgi:small multidrug resistance pump
MSQGLDGAAVSPKPVAPRARSVHPDPPVVVLLPGIQPRSQVVGWMRSVLIAAGAYNLVWGGLAILAPEFSFRIVGMQPPRYPELWQCIGMIVGVYGVGYLAAATDPLRHWPITLVGLLGKVFGPIGFAGALISGRFPLAFGWNILTNDLIWWLPFAGILWAAWKQSRTAVKP